MNREIIMLDDRKTCLENKKLIITDLINNNKLEMEKWVTKVREIISQLTMNIEECIQKVSIANEFDLESKMSFLRTVEEKL